MSTHASSMTVRTGPSFGVALLLALAPLATLPVSNGSFAAGVTSGLPSELPEAPRAPAAEFILEPADGAWLRFSPSLIRIRFLNASLGLRQDVSSVHLDGEERSFGWSASSQTIEVIIEMELRDGIHPVEASLVHLDGSVTSLVWSFGLDTQVPEVTVEPLSPATTTPSVTVRGRAVDSWLAGVTIQGEEVPRVGEDFSATIRLWPGPNDILVEARDRAGNLGRAVRVVSLQIPPFEGPSTSMVVEDGSFAVEIPDGWAAQEGIQLPSGDRIDLIAVAIAPAAPGLETTLLVASDRTARTFSDASALEWMDLVLASVAASGQLKQIVSRPRVVDNPLDTVTVQSTFLRQTALTQLTFNQLTMVWSQLLQRQWVLLATVDERHALERWAAINATVASFRLLDPGVGEPPGIEPAFFAYTVIVVAAIAALVAIAAVALLPLYIARRRRQRAERWRPPRNWNR